MAQQESAGNRLRDTPCIQSLLGFFFNKGVRGGPKIFLNLAAVLLGLLVVIKLMPQRLSDSALNSIPHDLWTGEAQETLQTDDSDDGSIPGGLRMVVFGENDIATPVGQDEEVEGSKSWTEALCVELECSKHISMVPSPNSTAWSVSSKALYAQGVENVLNETAASSSPGMDYSYLSTEYAPKWQTLDLKDQVDRFLAMPKPRHAPKETLWVFNFGFWDVWSLSALPIPAGKAAADAMTRDIFEQIERLYEASTDPRSVAWSDIKYIPAPPEPETSPEAGNEESPAEDPPVGGPTEKRDEGSAESGSQAESNAEGTSEYFRLLIPRITDPSLLPGWRDLRAQLPKVHSKAEQMRNSAELTEHWNDRIVDRLVEWVRKENKTAGEEENKESKRAEPADAAAPLSPPADIPATQTITQGKKVDKNPPQSRSSPIRDGFAFNMANYVLDAMVERQLRNARQHDGSGRGDGAPEDGFRDVTNSCVERVDTALVAVSVESGVRLEIPNEEIGGDVQVPSATKPENQQTRRRRTSTRDDKEGEGEEKKDSKANDPVDLAAKAAETVKVCQIPSDYLFYTPFALSQKAIGDIAAQTADMIRNNETIRGKLQAQMDKPLGPAIGSSLTTGVRLIVTDVTRASHEHLSNTSSSIRQTCLPSHNIDRRQEGHTRMSPSPSSSGLLPMPGTPAWRARIASVFRNADAHVLVAFWLFGLINNVLYVIILSAAQDLIGNLPKGIVLLADVMPSFVIKLVGPYFIHRVPYAVRIPIFAGLSTIGMLLIALTPATGSVPVKMLGVVLASLSSGGGELSFLGLTHYYGHMSLAAWGSGTGGAGLAGAGLYVMLTTWMGFSVRDSLLASAFLPVVMLLSFFVILPQGPLRQSTAFKSYEALPEQDLADDDVDDMPAGNASSSLLAPGPAVASTAYSAHPEGHSGSFVAHLRRAKKLVIPYMLPLFMVYVAEYTINQGVSPTLLFPLESSPFAKHRDFYPFYNFLYQFGVFISRSSTPFVRIHHVYIPSFLQVGNLVLLTLHALLNFIPTVYIVFLVVFWEGLLGGAVYVNTYAEILENVPVAEREFSLGATSVADSAGICLAGFIGMAVEVWLCDWQVRHGRDWCRNIKVG